MTPEPTPERPADEGGTVDEALDRVADLYTRNVIEIGARAEGVGWKNEEQHLLRFEKLSALIEPSDAEEGAEKGFEVIDLGCGYGAFFPWLVGRYGERLTRYTGYDVSAEMLAAARAGIDDPRAVFVEGAGVDRDADYSFVSGTFHVRFDATYEAWTEYVEEQLIQLAARSRRGLALNLLSTYVDWKEDHLYYADPGRFFDFCKRRLSRYVTLLHDYPLYEWTILVRME